MKAEVYPRSSGAPKATRGGRMKSWEWLALAAIISAGAWLRFSNLDLLEFKGDEAMALHLASKLIHGAGVPLAGLMSSVKVTNPPLFIYLLGPLVLISNSPAFVSCCIAVLGLAAVVVCWHIGRKYYGAVAGLVGAAMFAVSPWAVIYSRKIWAQDFVPVFATGTIWAVHALVVGKKPKAVFWALLLPLCVIQIHFSGLVLTATVVAILLVLRPKIDWRFAAAGVALAALIALPYLKFQTENHWADFSRAAATIGGQKYQIPPGMRVEPNTGYALPQHDYVAKALAISNAGQLEDILGLSAAPALDPSRVWRGDYFRSRATVVDWLLIGQGWLLVVALVWLVWRGARGDDRPQAWMLALWLVVPVLVYAVTGLWVYLSYFVILYPAPFLVVGWAVARLWTGHGRMAVGVVTALAVAANVWVLWDVYRFVDRHGGAHGTYGTVLVHKQSAARYLASQVDVPKLMQTGRLLQMDRVGELTRARMDVVLLALHARDDEQTTRATNTTVIVVDENRANFNKDAYDRWLTSSGEREMGWTNFGPLRLHFLRGTQ
jgi:hypothetical protein